MKNIKNFVAGVALAGILSMGVSTANAGILMADATGMENPNPCSEKQEVKVDSGILVTGFGILVTGFTGILVTGAAADTKTPTQTDCGILMTD